MAQVTKIGHKPHQIDIEHLEAFAALLLSTRKRAERDSIFSPEDTTAGTETELQAAVEGSKSYVDLALTIEDSSYLANVLRGAAAGDTSRRVFDGLMGFLSDHDHRIWENSWVRFPKSVLGRRATDVFQNDLLSDKSAPQHGMRSDIDLSHISQGLDCLEEDLRVISSPTCPKHYTIGRLFYGLLSSVDPAEFVRSLRQAVLSDKISINDLKKLIFVLLLNVRADEAASHDNQDDLEATVT
jgi:hypothetical protein